MVQTLGVMIIFFSFQEALDLAVNGQESPTFTYRKKKRQKKAMIGQRWIGFPVVTFPVCKWNDICYLSIYIAKEYYCQ